MRKLDTERVKNRNIASREENLPTVRYSIKGSRTRSGPSSNYGLECHPASCVRVRGPSPGASPIVSQDHYQGAESKAEKLGTELSFISDGDALSVQPVRPQHISAQKKITMLSKKSKKKKMSSYLIYVWTSLGLPSGS